MIRTSEKHFYFKHEGCLPGLGYSLSTDWERMFTSRTAETFLARELFSSILGAEKLGI